jgi:hypothetical protein
VRTNGVAGPLSERRFVESARVAVVVNCTIMRKSVWYGIVDATDVNTFYFGAADPLANMCETLARMNMLGGSRIDNAALHSATHPTYGSAGMPPIF